MRRSARELPTIKHCLEREIWDVRCEEHLRTNRKSRALLSPQMSPGSIEMTHLVTVSSNGSSSSIFLFEKAKDKPKGLGFDLAVERLHYLASCSWREVSPVTCRSWKRLIMAIERGPGSGGNAKKGEQEPDRKGLSLLLSPAPLATQQHHLLARDRLRRRWKGPLIPGEGSCTPLS